MALTTLEILATILIVITAIKLVVLLVNPKAWMNFANRLWVNHRLMQIISLILAAVVLYYLLGAGVTITTILAVTLFIALLIALGFAPYAEDLIKKVNLKTMWKDHWLYTIIWVILILWGAKEIFM